MEGNKITIAILVSTFTLIIIALCLTPYNSAPTDSPNPSELTSKCWSPPTKEFHKQILWSLAPHVWPEADFTEIPVHAKFDIYYYYCNTEFKLIYNDVATDAAGWLEYPLYLIPGKYKIVLDGWIPEDEPLCCAWEHEFLITCRDISPIYVTNYIENKVKGGDKAFLFFQQCTTIRKFSYHANNSLPEPNFSGRERPR